VLKDLKLSNAVYLVDQGEMNDVFEGTAKKCKRLVSIANSEKFWTKFECI
jgi:hypothetical protein